MASVLSIDYGLKRIGLAVSDPSRTFAFPSGVIENKNLNFVFDSLRKIVDEKEIDLIIVGLPYNMDKTKSKMTEQVEEFIKRLQDSFNIQIKTIDERLSSFAAEENLKDSGLNSKKAKKFVDEEAARLLLVEFLENNMK